jgi:hypothetical protein
LSIGWLRWVSPGDVSDAHALRSRREVNALDNNELRETEKVEVIEVVDEVAPDLTLYADWLTYEVVPGGPGK